MATNFYTNLLKFCKERNEGVTTVLNNLDLSQSNNTYWKKLDGKPTDAIRNMLAEYFNVPVEAFEIGIAACRIKKYLSEYPVDIKGLCEHLGIAVEVWEREWLCNQAGILDENTKRLAEALDIYPEFLEKISVNYPLEKNLFLSREKAAKDNAKQLRDTKGTDIKKIRQDRRQVRQVIDTLAQNILPTHAFTPYPFEEKTYFDKLEEQREIDKKAFAEVMLTAKPLIVLKEQDNKYRVFETTDEASAAVVKLLLSYGLPENCYQFFFSHLIQMDGEDTSGEDTAHEETSVF